MRKAFLIHVGSALETIKKKGYFKVHKDANKAYVEQRELMKQAKATLAELDRTTNKGTGSSKKPSKKHKEAAATAGQPDPNLQAECMSDLKKAKEATEKAKAKVELAAQDMFQLNANVLSVDAKYAWNKIVHEKTQSDPYTDLQGVSKKAPRGYVHKSFNNCMIFHLLAMFPNNAVEQERYYITNVLKKKPQRISVSQFVQRVEQLNSYIVQLPCWFYSPSAKPSMIPMNVLFT
jgi:hypothetical protein